jgi:polyhydroxyalkanoate synthase
LGSVWGALTEMLAAYLGNIEDDRLGTITLLNTLLGYSEPGVLGGSVRYVLSSGGHIAGIVNPPSPKSWYETAESNPADVQRHGGSWWENWVAWTDARVGDIVAPPPMGSRRYPALDEAPGDYVRG